MVSQQSGLLERLRAQRESMAAAATGAPAPMAIPDDDDGIPGPGPAPAAPMAPRASGGAVDEEATRRISLLETDSEDLKKRLEAVETRINTGFTDLRNELPTMISAEVGRLTTTTNEAVVDLGGRVSRLESDFTRERERWSSVVTSFDQRLDHRLRSFRSDVTVMLAGMGVLVLAMLMLILLRR